MKLSASFMRTANALADIHTTRYRSFAFKVVRHFGHGDFRGIAVRAGFTGCIACAGPLAEGRLIGMVLANEAAIVAACIRLFECLCTHHG
jgi:hypothetical protein